MIARPGNQRIVPQHVETEIAPTLFPGSSGVLVRPTPMSFVPVSFASLVLSFLWAVSSCGQTLSPAPLDNVDIPPMVVKMLQSNCMDCHDHATSEGGLALDRLLEEPVAAHAAAWEAVVRKLTSRQMPPLGAPRPAGGAYDEAVTGLAFTLDELAATRLEPGRTETFRRLTQTEYHNAIRDLLGLEIDVTDLLPADEASHGFDNVTVSNLSPVLLDRYVSAAQKISRLAVGVRADQAAEATYRVPPDVTQDTHILETPIGTRGGTVIRHHFPQDGRYEIQAWLMRDRNEEVEGLRGSHRLEFLLDRREVATFAIKPPPRGVQDHVVDANLKRSLHVTAGPHDVVVAFAQQSAALQETLRQPLNVHYNYYRHPRLGPAIYQVTIRGPFAGKPSLGTASRKIIFQRSPGSDDDPSDCAKTNLRRLLRKAYRREITDVDLDAPMTFFRQGFEQHGFDIGMELALSAILVNPQFLFRIEREPADAAPGEVYRISPLELASRLSFSLWSSIPDDELLQMAIDGRLSDPDVLDEQVRRMLADPKSESLVKNFAGQWLYLRNLDSFIPDMRLYPDFDENLRQSMRRETELLFESIVREDRSVLDLLRSNHTYLNERLAKHYGIPHVYGSHFRRVELESDSHRGGLLRQGSILCVTSYATRTSPVVRGHWVLKNVLGTPPPPPPPNVPALEENTVSATLSVRQRLEQHRANAACASCHDVIDPVGFALEHYDAVGRWRETDDGQRIDSSARLIDGREIAGVADLEQALLDRPELFVQTLTEKLLTYTLGRGVEHYDGPAIRKIVQEAKKKDYCFSELIIQIAHSVPFQMRRSE